RRVAHHRAEPRDVPQDAAEPLVGGGIQHRRDSVSRRCNGVEGYCTESGSRRGAHVAQHDHRRHQCAVAAKTTPVTAGDWRPNVSTFCERRVKSTRSLSWFPTDSIILELRRAQRPPTCAVSWTCL